jgi:glycosyltransferase involved in cell wall biosynthesis
MTERVTVVIPTRNRPDLLRSTLMSVSRQRDVEVDVVVVDDASDEEAAYAAADIWSLPVRFLRQAVRSGPNAARNRGMAEASAPWISFCDDDDLWAPDKLSRQLAAAEGSRCNWAYTGSVYVNDDLQVRGGSPPLQPDALVAALGRFNALPAAASNVIVRADVLREIGGFDEGLPHLADWELWLRLAAQHQPSCADAALVAYRLHRSNFSFDTAGMLTELEILERRHDLVADRSRFHRHLGRLSLQAGRRSEALRHFALAALHMHDGYHRADLSYDWRILREHASEIVRRRLRLPPSDRTRRRRDAARANDPNAAWKAEAQAWLDGLPRP